MGQPQWDARRQGIWTSTRRLSHGRWQFSKPRHQTHSAYDALDALTAAGGRAVLGFHRP
jgi:hypothetical protein